MLGPPCPPKCHQLPMLDLVSSDKAILSPRDYFESRDSALRGPLCSLMSVLLFVLGHFPHSALSWVDPRNGNGNRSKGQLSSILPLLPNHGIEGSGVLALVSPQATGEQPHFVLQTLSDPPWLKCSTLSPDLTPIPVWA